MLKYVVRSNWESQADFSEVYLAKSEINQEASGVIATLNSDNTITLSNTTGNDIVIGGSAPTDAVQKKEQFTTSSRPVAIISPFCDGGQFCHM